jgi:hypothetical protein
MGQMDKGETCHAERSSDDREAIVATEPKHPYS